jgi:hypothetical protein
MCLPDHTATRLNGSFSLFVLPSVQVRCRCFSPVQYDPIQVAAGQSFQTTTGETVNINWSNHGAIHLWGTWESFTWPGRLLESTMPCRLIEVPCCRGLHWP